MYSLSLFLYIVYNVHGIGYNVPCSYIVYNIQIVNELFTNYSLIVDQLFIIGDNKLLSHCYINYITNGSINYNLNCKQIVIQIHKQMVIQIHK